MTVESNVRICQKNWYPTRKLTSGEANNAVDSGIKSTDSTTKQEGK